MAKLTAKNAVIAVDDSGGSAQTISGDVESFECVYTVQPVDVTGFGEPQNFTPGLLVTGVTLNVRWNTAATTGATTVLKGIVGSATSKTVSVTPEGTGLAFSGEFMCDGITISGSPSTDIKLGAVHFSPMGAVAATIA